MAEHSQTQNNRHPSGQALRKRLEERKEENKSLAEKAHRASTMLHGVMQGINSIFRLIASSLRAYKEIPVIGFALQMVALVPQSISTLTNPAAGIRAKIF
ncbi:MAG: T4SS effector SidA family protein, partial [Gammaproteobacteria bacterium]|nr:T4SS effector SidA family protein [Gammaproteobacteria bacterium]